MNNMVDYVEIRIYNMFVFPNGYYVRLGSFSAISYCYVLVGRLANYQFVSLYVIGD